MITFLLWDALDIVIVVVVIIVVVKMVDFRLSLQRKREEAEQRRIERADERRYERESERAERKRIRQEARNDRRLFRQKARQERKLERQRAIDNRKQEIQNAEIARNAEMQRQQFELQKTIISSQINNGAIARKGNCIDDSIRISRSEQSKPTIIALECPKCGASIEIDSQDQLKCCKYCGATLRYTDDSSKVYIQKNTSQTIHVSAAISSTMKSEIRDHSKVAKYVWLTLLTITITACFAFIVFGLLRMNGIL